MPTKRQSPAEPKPTAAQSNSRDARQLPGATAAGTVAPKESIRFSTMARKIREQVKDRLESEFEDFVTGSTMEEQRFMIEVLNDWDNMAMGGGSPRPASSHDVAIYSAIQRQLDNSICVVLPYDDMLHQVEEFITALSLSRRLTKKRYEPTPIPTNDEIIARLERQFRCEIELFVRDAGRPSLRLMLDMLARWNEIANDPQLLKLPNTLAIAAEIELDKLRAEEAAAPKKDA